MVGEGLKPLGVNYFQTDFALVQNIQTGNNSLNFEGSIFGVDDLLFEGVFVGLIQDEVRWESIVKERVLVFKDDFDLVDLFLVQQFLVEKDSVVVVSDLARLEHLPVDAQVLDWCAVEVEFEVLAVAVEAFQEEGQLDDPLVNIALVQVEDHFVDDVREVGVTFDGVVDEGELVLVGEVFPGLD